MTAVVFFSYSGTKRTLAYSDNYISSNLLFAIYDEIRKCKQAISADIKS